MSLALSPKIPGSYTTSTREEFFMSNVIVVIGAGSIGQAIARRVSAGKNVLLADLRPKNTDAAAKVFFLMDGGVTAAYLYGDLAPA